MKKIISIFMAVIMLFSIMSFNANALSSAEILNTDKYTDETSFVPLCALELDCEEEALTVVDNVIYKLSDNGKYYSVVFLFDTVKSAKTKTQINIVNYIDDIPVTRVTNCDWAIIRQYKYGINVTKITLPDTIKLIGRYAFAHLYNLEEINLPSSLETLGSAPFLLTKIKQLNIPETTTNIKASAFAGMQELTKVTLPKSLTRIPYECFGGCKKLEKVVFKGNNLTYIGNFAFANCKSLKSIKLPSSLMMIDLRAFSKTGLEKITLPKNCDVIWNYAFADCKKLKKVTFKAKQVDLRGNAFQNCTSLNTVVNSKNIVALGSQAFYNCKSLKKFTIGKIKINHIGIRSCVFQKCSSLKKLVIVKQSTKEFTRKKTFKGIPKTCKAYVKTKAMKNTVKKCGFNGKIIIEK